MGAPPTLPFPANAVAWAQQKAGNFFGISSSILIISTLALVIICGVLTGILYQYVGTNSFYCLTGLIVIPLFPFCSCSIFSSASAYDSFLRFGIEASPP